MPVAKTLQFRCPGCLKLLYKYEVGKDTCEFTAEGAMCKKTEKGFFVKCPKCDTISLLKKDGRVRAEDQGISLSKV